MTRAPAWSSSAAVRASRRMARGPAPTFNGDTASSTASSSTKSAGAQLLDVRNHPGSLLPGVSLIGSLQIKAVPADQIIHLYQKERQQMRGTPWGSAVIRSLGDLEDYTIAEIIRKTGRAL